VVRLAAAVRGVITGERGVELDYAAVVDADTLEPAMTLRKPVYILLAAKVGTTRLIDNAFVEPAGDSLLVNV
jgi:pantoate--beta-alanine ligase